MLECGKLLIKVVRVIFIVTFRIAVTIGISLKNKSGTQRF